VECWTVFKRKELFAKYDHAAQRDEIIHNFCKDSYMYVFIHTNILTHITMANTHVYTYLGVCNYMNIYTQEKRFGATHIWNKAYLRLCWIYGQPQALSALLWVIFQRNPLLCVDWNNSDLLWVTLKQNTPLCVTLKRLHLCVCDTVNLKSFCG